MTDSPAASDRELRMSYRIGRGEQGVLTFEPYKGALLPHWRFRTPAAARESAAELWRRFEAYEAAGDFVGMDMARKFIQMGMTRARRYANYKGGRKYAKRDNDRDKDGDGADEQQEGEETKAEKKGRQLEKSVDHKGKKEKEEASAIFREVWERCKAHEGYQEKKEEFLKEQKAWDKEHKKR